jgi:hypothetical protein
MKSSKFCAIGLALIFIGTGISYGLGAPQGAGGEGPGGGSYITITSLFPFIAIIALITFMVKAIIRDVKSIKREEQVNVAIAAIVLTILFWPVGFILSFAVIKKAEK